jgi:D-aminoacyl-tRNA deacylase
MIALVAWRADPAGMNIVKKLEELYEFRKLEERFDGNCVLEGEIGLGTCKLYLIEREHVYADYVNDIEAEAIIFLSKHSSASGKPTISVHPIGNWGKAMLGGRDKKLVPASSGIMSALLKKIEEEMEEHGLTSYELSYEATHHGPWVEKPCCFVEIGSRKVQWTDECAAEVVARAVAEATQDSCKTFVGIGGPHYNPRFTRLTLRCNIGFSHMCAKYALSELDRIAVMEAVAKTVEEVDGIAVDEKGLGGEKKRVWELLNGLDMDVKKVKELKREC